MARPKNTLPTKEDKWCPYCSSDDSAITDPDERIAKLKAENKKLRDRIRELTYEEDPQMRAWQGYWQKAYGVQSLSYQADGNVWPASFPNWRGRISLNVNYGGGSQYIDWQFFPTYEDAKEYAERSNTLLSNEHPGFHWRRGYYFNRYEDGTVEIIVRPTLQHIPLLLARIPENEWASIVCSVSKEGETGERWDAARVFHGKDIPNEAFARHRLAARKQALEDAAAKAEALKSDDTDWDTSYWNQACERVAFVLLSMIEEK